MRLTVPATARTHIDRLALPAAVALLAAVVGLVAFAAAAMATVEIGPARVTVDLGIAAHGVTTIELPPFGSVAAATHPGPITLRLGLAALDLNRLDELAAQGLPSAETVAGYRAEVLGAVRTAALVGLLAAAALAALTAWSLTRSPAHTLRGALAAVLLIAAAGGLAAATYDLQAFAEPHYEGALEYAPAAIALVQERADIVTDAQRQVRSLARDLVAYYGAPQTLGVTDPLDDTLRVLHVSDLHLDPVGMQLALDLAVAYDVELVIDTGDLSHFGTAAEASLAVAQLGSIDHLYIPGNHDTPAFVAALEALPAVSVLREETTTTASGIRVFGLGDPAGQMTTVEPDSDAARAAGERAAAALRSRLASGEPTPTIVAVHDPAAGEAFEGLAQVVLAGHTHTAEMTERAGTRFINAGTTGGVHFSELRAVPHIPHGAVVLYFSREPAPRLVAIDQIEVFGTGGQSSVRRTVIALDPE